MTLSLLSRLCLVAIVSVAIFLLQSCSENQTPENLALDFIERAETAVQERNIRDLRTLISTDYQDPEGRSSRDILAIASAYIIRSKSIHVLLRLHSASQVEDGIQAKVLVALAARPIDDPALLPRLNADIYWFDIVLEKRDGDWKLLSAVWHQAMVDDFMTN